MKLFGKGDFEEMLNYILILVIMILAFITIPLWVIPYSIYKRYRNES